MNSTFKALGLIVGSLVLLLGSLGVWFGYTTGAFIGASDVQIIDSTAAVRDARQLIDGFRASASVDDRSQFLRPEQLPQSLRLPKLLHAYVFRDHINLVLGRNPDWSVGARVWSKEATTVHADQPTAYPEIFFFKYCNDIPTSPKNLQ